MSDNSLDEQHGAKRVASVAKLHSGVAADWTGSRLSLPLPPCDDVLFAFDSRDQRSRSFNLLRGQILRMAKSNGLRTVGVTSATPKVGKSFVAANLAASLSRIAELETVLVDLDLRRCSVAEIFKLEPGVGVSEYLAGEASSLEELSWRFEGVNLSVLPAFSRAVRSSELLSSPRFDGLLAEFTSFSDPLLCVLDLPPVFANDDAVIITQKIDGYLFVIEEGVTTKREVNEAMRLLRPATCIGTVLNRFRGSVTGDGYGYGYGSTKAYSDYYK